MFAGRLTNLLLLVFLGAAWDLVAQQAEGDRKRFEKTKTKAEAGIAEAQLELSRCYRYGSGVAINEAEALKWCRKAAEQGLPIAQNNLGSCYQNGEGVGQDMAEATRWYRKAAEQGLAKAQCNLGLCYLTGNGVSRDESEAARWLRQASERGNALAQLNLGICCINGEGVAEDDVQAYKWIDLAGSQGRKEAPALLADLEKRLTAGQVEEAKRLAGEFKEISQAEEAPSTPPTPNKSRVEEIKGPETAAFSRAQAISEFHHVSSGTGFFITDDGFLITNEHVVRDATEIRVVTATNMLVAKVVKADAANDIALLKAEMNCVPLALASSSRVKMGSTVATVGYPNIDLQGFAPKLAKGEIAALSGAQDDPRYFQISLPVQPGNSGGALVDERGNVIGIVSAKISLAAALATSGSLPENVNYAIKSSFVLAFLESVPDLSAKLKEPNSKERKFEDVVASTEQATVLVLCRGIPTPAPIIIQPMPVSDFVSSGHTIESVLDDGNFIKLDDGSLWQVSPFDTGDSSSWSESSEITIIKVDETSYPYKLIDTDDNESVRARPVRR